MIQGDPQMEGEEPVHDAIEPDVEPPDIIAPEPAVSEVEVSEDLEQVITPPPSKLRRLLRSALLWAVGMVGVFALGVGATWFTQVSRFRAENDALRVEMEAMRIEAAAELETLRTQHEEEIDALRADSAEAESHIDLLNALVDLASARVALGLKDVVGVRAALAGTDERLEALQQVQGEDGKVAVQALREQLADVLDDLKDDLSTADKSLERLAANLLVLERSLFSD
jgi:hypothetical protein